MEQEQNGNGRSAVWTVHGKYFLTCTVHHNVLKTKTALAIIKTIHYQDVVNYYLLSEKVYFTLLGNTLVSVYVSESIKYGDQCTSI